MISQLTTNFSSINDLRQATDDNLSSVLSELGYDESFKLIDTKLALGYSTVIIAGLLYYIDKKYTFQESFNVTALSIVAYFLISGVLSYLKWTNKDVKYVGYTPKGKKISISGWTEKFDSVYKTKIVLNGDDKNAVFADLEFSKLFDILGYFSRDGLLSLLKKEISKIEKKDE